MFYVIHVYFEGKGFFNILHVKSLQQLNFFKAVLDLVQYFLMLSAEFLSIGILKQASFEILHVVIFDVRRHHQFEIVMSLLLKIFVFGLSFVAQISEFLRLLKFLVLIQNVVLIRSIVFHPILINI